MDLLHPSTGENIPERTGTRFTVRSANSPSYSFTRRSGIRKRPTNENVKEISCSNNNENKSAVNQTELNQNGTAERKHLENGIAYGVTPELHGQGREGRRGNLPSRSMSLDWRLGEKSPPWSTRADTSKFSGKREAGGFLEQRTETENMSRNGTSSLRVFRSAGLDCNEDNHPVNQGDFADRASKVNSLPFRFKSESGTGLRLECSSGPQGGHSIQERIQKLFESAGEKTVGGTFPRRFSSGEDYSPVRKTVPSIWAPKETNPSRTETLVSPETVNFKKSSTGTQKQGQFSNKNLEQDRWRSDTLTMGTKSLDRVRSRNTIAAQIRSARTTTDMSQPQGFVGDTLSIFQLRRASMNQDDSLPDTTERIKVKDGNKDRDEETRHQTEVMCGFADGDVFFSNPRKDTLQFPERNKPPEILSVPSSASVRNKINQFEALTQRASQVQIPRRTFSVPAQLCKAQEGVKKSGSAKYIGKQSYNWETNTDGKIENRKMFGSERSLSVDKVGYRLAKSETDEDNLFYKSKNDFSEDLCKYSNLKKTLHLPLNEGAQRHSRLLCLDEKDFDKRSSSKDSNSKGLLKLTQTSDIEPRLHCEVSSAVSDDEKTPTNTPQSTSPFISPVKDSEDSFPIPDNTSPLAAGEEHIIKDTDPSPPPASTLSQNSESDIFITHKDKTKDKDSLHLPTDISSQNNSSDVFSSDVKTELPKGKKQLMDLNKWIASLNPEYKSWDDCMREYEDDDEESTEKDADSNYDSDSGESSVTITSNMSQSENRSFSLSLSELCNFSGADYESENDSDDWQLPGRRSASLSSDISAFSCVSLIPTEELDKLVEDVKNLGDDTLQDYNDVKVVVLHKEVGVGLGFSLAGGVDQNKPITVHKVFNSGVAAQEGSISEGDHVLSINGTALSESAHWEALRTLRRAKAREMAVVVLRTGDLSVVSKSVVQESHETETTTQYETGQRVCVQLEKNSRDLGFSLQGGVGSSEGNRPLTVQKIFQGGPVDKVFPGDEILEIQGTSVVEMRRLEVWTFIKNLASGPVKVVLRRPLKVTQL